MGNKFGKNSPEKVSSDPLSISSKPSIIEKDDFDLTPREQVTKEDEQYAKENFAGLISKNDSERLKQQEEVKKIFAKLNILTTTQNELENSFKKNASMRTVIENLDRVKNQTLPAIPLVGEVVNKIIDLGMIVGKRYLDRSNTYLLCLFAFNNISEIFEPLAVIDKFYDIIIKKKQQEEPLFRETLEKHDFEDKWDKFKELKRTIQEIIAETSVMMLEQSVIVAINNQFTQGQFKDFYCSQPSKYKLEDPTFFETIISTAIEIKQQNKNMGKIFTIPQILIEELNRKLIGLSINFSVIMAGYQDLKNVFPNIDHELDNNETKIIENFVNNVEAISTQNPDEIPDEKPAVKLTGGTRRRNRKTKKYKKKRKSLKTISKDFKLKKSKRRF